MAASCTDTEVNNESSENNEGMSGFDDWDDGLEEEGDQMEDMTKLSLFCRCCLNPYVGERSVGGQLVLRCRKCLHTDVVTDEMLAQENDIEILIGDIISNKFNKILKFEQELKNIDLNDPYNVEDDLKRLHEMHAPILKEISEVTNGMRRVINGHRMDHNMRVYRERHLLRNRVNTNPMSCKGNKKDTENMCLVEILGSAERNNFILDPSSFTFTESVILKLSRIGRDGIINIDRMLLTVGLPYTFIKDNMPLYHNRLQKYRTNIGCKYKPNSDLSESCKTCSCDLSERSVKTPMKYKISDNDILCDEDDMDYSIKENYNSHPELSFPTHMKRENKVAIQPRKSTVKQLSKSTKHKRKISSKSRDNKCDEIASMMDCLAPPSENATDIDSIISSMAEPADAGFRRCQTQWSKDFGIDFRAHIGMSDFQADYDEQHFILRHIGQIECDDVIDFSTHYVNMSSIEVVDGLGQRKSEAASERRKRTIDFLKTASALMRSKVDEVQDDVINDLRKAYRAKMIRTKTQKKLLEEERGRMENCNTVLKDVEESIDAEQFQAIIDKINVLQREN